MSTKTTARSGRRPRWLLPFVLLDLVLTLLATGAYVELHQPLSQQADTIVDVHNGETLHGVLIQLQAEGIVAPVQAGLLNVWARLYRGQAPIRAGEYRLVKGTSSLGLLQLLRSGKVILHDIRFIEGWRFSQVWHQVEQDPNIDHTLSGPDVAGLLMRELGSAGQPPEGRFFADTYRFPKGTTDVALLRQAYQAMEHRLSAAWANRAPDLPYASPDEALIMASLVEKETAVDSERAQIAGVFLRRLKLHMKLQTDPAVIYGLGDRYDGNLHTSDLRTDTPWNTYTRDGLPPTPICMPSEASLIAALHPADGEALYFVARGDGTHQFSATLDEHNAAVRRYQLGEKNGK